MSIYRASKKIYKHKASGKLFDSLYYISVYAGVPVERLTLADYEVIVKKKKQSKERIYLNELKFD